MPKESEATDGQKLLALISSMNCRVGYAHMLKQIPDKIHPSWDELAESLRRSHIEALPFPPTPARSGGE